MGKFSTYVTCNVCDGEKEYTISTYDDPEKVIICDNCNSDGKDLLILDDCDILGARGFIDRKLEVL